MHTGGGGHNGGLFYWFWGGCSCCLARSSTLTAHIGAKVPAAVDSGCLCHRGASGWGVGGVAPPSWSPSHAAAPPTDGQFTIYTRCAKTGGSFLILMIKIQSKDTQSILIIWRLYIEINKA